MASKTKSKAKPKKAAPKKKEAKPKGRPSTYTDAVARQICQRLADGESLRQICADQKMPGKSTVLRWLFEDDKQKFQDQYARAREVQAENWADEILEIADDGSNDWIERETQAGNVITVVDQEHIGRSRLRVDSRKWLMSKLLPKKYGDKQHLEHSGEINGGVMAVPVPIDPQEWAAKAKEYQAAITKRG